MEFRDDGVYGAYDVGEAVRLIVLDTRYERSPISTAPEVTSCRRVTSEAIFRDWSPRNLPPAAIERRTGELLRCRLALGVGCHARQHVAGADGAHPLARTRWQRLRPHPVSYTHLTLPTSDLV